MQTVIIAAGLGKRLRPLTRETQKTMLRVQGKPILEHTMSCLPDDVDEVVLVVGWRGDQVRRYFGESFGGRSIKYVNQIEQKGTYHALNCARPLLKEGNFLLFYGDDLFSKNDIKKLNKHDIAVLVKETDKPERFGICRIDESDNLLAITEKPKEYCGNLANIGAYKLNHNIFNIPVFYTEKGEDYVAPMIGELAKTHSIKVVRAAFWHPIADVSDLERAQKLDLSTL